MTQKNKMLEKEKYIIQNINHINISKYTGLVLGLNFILGGLYKGVYFFAIGIESSRVELSLIDYIRFGLDMLPLVTLIAMYSGISIKPPKPVKPESVSVIKVNKGLEFAAKYWIPELTFLTLFILFETGILDSIIVLVIIIISPVFIYYFHHKRFEKMLKGPVSFFYKFLIKFLIFILVLFTIRGAVDGHKDMAGNPIAYYSINLRTGTQFGKTLKRNTVIDGYIFKSFDNITIAKINGKIAILNNLDIMNIIKKEVPKVSQTNSRGILKEAPAGL